MISKLHMALLVWAASLVLAAAQPGAPPQDAKNFHIYLLMSSGAVAKEVSFEGKTHAPLEHCMVMNDQKQWESARLIDGEVPAIGTATKAWSGPAREFALEMIKQKPGVTIGLIFNVEPDKNIEDCCGMKTEPYRFSRRHSLLAMKQGSLKGLLWQGGGAMDPLYTDLDHLENLISNLRSDLRRLEMPVVVGETPGKASHNSQLKALTEDVHATGLANGGKGAAYAKAMIELETKWPDNRPTPSPKFAVIDPHIHAFAARPGGLDAVAAWMERNRVERCITSPIGDSRAVTPEQKRIELENHKKYAGKIDRFCLIEPGEVATVEEAVKILEAEKANGAVGFGEHYGRDLMFDDPKNIVLYQACGKVGLPVMFHIDTTKNMVKQGMRRVERVLELCPDTKIIAHAQWWLQMPQGTCDQMLQKYPNLYADVSGLQMVSVLNRDRGYTRDFLTRHQDKVLFATDAGWWSFGKPIEERELQFELFERLGLEDAVLEKIYRKNTMKLFGWE